MIDPARAPPLGGRGQDPDQVVDVDAVAGPPRIGRQDAAAPAQAVEGQPPGPVDPRHSQNSHRVFGKRRTDMPQATQVEIVSGVSAGEQVVIGEVTP